MLHALHALTAHWPPSARVHSTQTSVPTHWQHTDLCPHACTHAAACARSDWGDVAGIAQAVQEVKERHYKELTQPGIPAFPGEGRGCTWGRETWRRGSTWGHAAVEAQSSFWTSSQASLHSQLGLQLGPHHCKSTVRSVVLTEEGVMSESKAVWPAPEFVPPLTDTFLKRGWYRHCCLPRGWGEELSSAVPLQRMRLPWRQHFLQQMRLPWRQHCLQQMRLPWRQHCLQHVRLPSIQHCLRHAQGMRGARDLAQQGQGEKRKIGTLLSKGRGRRERWHELGTEPVL